jgi:uncharacterized protein (TIGR02246 family)
VAASVVARGKVAWMTQRIKFLGCLCVLALILTVPQQSVRASTPEVSSTEADFRATRGWLESYVASINAGDLAAFGKLWADDADWAPPDAPMLRGRQAILVSARAAFDRYSMHHELTSQAIKVVDGFAVALITSAERYTPKAGAGAAWEQSVKGAVMLRRSDDGSWTATYFLWNRDAPPPPGAIQSPTPPGR